MKTNLKILLVEDSDAFRAAVATLLGVYNDVEEANSISSARDLIRSTKYDVAILDKGLPDGDGIELITEIKATSPNTVVIILTSDSDFSSVKHCIARGADDYVVKAENVVPDLLVRIPVAVSKAASRRRMENLEEHMRNSFRYEIVGKSEQTMELRESILSLKNSNAHVLITGESGTGKELIARRLNAIEDAAARPFVAVNCGAIAENLIESELFGHKKGAFTGATQDRAGKFELADGGDVFLDEIGELPLAAQVKLLRVIQEGEITRVGDNRVVRVKCRIIAATNQDLELMIRAGKFREDLYHRLNVIRLFTAPLRERISDVPDLARSFTLQIGGANFKITPDALNALSEYEWPGNIRELRNSIERAVISARRRKSTTVDFQDVTILKPKEDSLYRMRAIQAKLPTNLNEVTPDGFKAFLKAIEREYFKCALELASGNVLEVVAKIGLARSTVFKRLKDLGVPTLTSGEYLTVSGGKLSSLRPRSQNEIGGNA